MAQYRKKPVVIEAVRWTGTNYVEVDEFTGKAFGYQSVLDPARIVVAIHTKEGTMLGEPGDWIIRGVKGEFYPCKPDIFEATYVSVTRRMMEIGVEGDPFNEQIGRGWGRER